MKGAQHNTQRCVLCYGGLEKEKGGKRTHRKCPGCDKCTGVRILPHTKSSSLRCPHHSRHRLRYRDDDWRTENAYTHIEHVRPIIIHDETTVDDFDSSDDEVASDDDGWGEADAIEDAMRP